MALKEILLHLDAAAPAAARLDLAAGIAKRSGAHLVGLHMLDLALPILAGDVGGGAAMAGLMDEMRAEAVAEAGRVQAMFEERLARDGISGEWRLLEGATVPLLAENGRYADLIILGQTDPDVPRPGGRALIEAALFETGRPVLVVPYAAAPAGPMRHALIAWNASREASRAVHDALPLLKLMERVTVLVVEPEATPGTHGQEPGADIARHLARHGLNVTVQRAVAPDISVADVILNTIAEQSADLLVMGGYGHSRLREFMLGGATRSLLGAMTAPVLMAH
ncbi:universal stress protein [Roseococcus microcysteis]|uniref:universal stress protein n=1 Tax=Roseococcus microcysteis TaxID=2771361 RepID=UPI00168AC476|nr:universal stress protein [Roseococcus microcysteis]